MDLYGSDFRLSDIGLAGDILQLGMAEYPLDMLDDHHLSGLMGPSCAPRNSGHGNAISAMDFRLAADTTNQMASEDWLDSLLDDAIFEDSLQTLQQPEHVKNEHSYSIADDENNNNQDCDNSFTNDLKLFKVKLETEKDMESELLREMTSSDMMLLTDTESSGAGNATTLSKPENAAEINHHHHCGSFARTSNSAVVTENLRCSDRKERVDVKIELDNDYQNGLAITHESDCVYMNTLLLPPTPPSSSNCSSSDSETGGTTPTRSAPSSPGNSPYTRQVSIRHNQNVWTATLHQPIFTTPISSNGSLFLTEEEKRTLISEGYPLPTKLPLSKQDEKNLKKIRRKIKNKISAQESRRKKKEYLESLEKKVETVSQENSHLRKKLDFLETNNRSLTTQLQRLQTIVGKLGPTQTGTCVMVFALFFAVFLGTSSPSLWSLGYGSSSSQSSMQSTLLRPDYNAPFSSTVDPYATVVNANSRLMVTLNDDDEDTDHDFCSNSQLNFWLFDTNCCKCDTQEFSVQPSLMTSMVTFIYSSDKNDTDVATGDIVIMSDLKSSPSLDSCSL